MRTYWKPHFVITKETIAGVVYQKCGIKEVHYEDDVPVLWTQEYMNITSHEESIEESLEQSIGLMDLYINAKDNTIFIESKDENNKDILVAYHKQV